MEIIYSDKDIAVCVKPVGIDSESGVPAELKNELGGEFFTLHRLDLNVGGVMVYARNKWTAAELSRAITDGSMVKEYLAVVHGAPPDSDRWTDLLFKDSHKNKVFVVKRERKGVKRAELEFEKLRQDTDTALVKIRLYTGRSHQIRVQFASRKHPLIGDGKYGSKVNCPIALFSARICTKGMEICGKPPIEQPWNIFDEGIYDEL